MRSDDAPLLTCRGISKRWSAGPGQPPALDAVDLTVRAGEVHVLLGENGAGKSTFVKIIAGLVTPDAGEVLVDGVPVAPGDVTAAQAVGVCLIHQEPRLFPDLDVVENMFLGLLPSGRFGIGFDRRAARRRAREVLSELGCTARLDEPVRNLSVADQQLIDIASALLRTPRILIVDEPTASLTPVEVDRLFGVLRGLRDRGVAVVFIGHRLDEILALSDSITVLRDGQVVGEVATTETTPNELVRMMVGREHAARSRSATALERRGELRLEVDGLSSPGAFSDVSLRVCAGEVVALAGLVGAGRTEIAEAVFGVRPRSAGRVVVHPSGRQPHSAAEAVRSGLAYVPEDRGRFGLVLGQSVSDNIATPSLGRWACAGVRRRPFERQAAAEAIGRFGVMCRGIDQWSGELSGGNQQKVSVARWMQTTPTVLIIDEPTRGVDVAAKAEIHHMIATLVDGGMAVLMISSELPEILALADRILVVREGRIAGEMGRDEATEEAIIALATRAADAGVRR